MTRWQDIASEHPRLATVLQRLRSCLPPLNFITIHYAYFITVCLISSVIFWGSSKPAFSISYTDSLFLVVSAMTEAGLNTVNLSQMTTWQQVMLWLLILLGSTIWVSIWTVLARKHVFEQRFDTVVRRSQQARGFERTGSAISIAPLPLLQRLVTFRKAQTVSTVEATLLGTGTRPTNGIIMDQVVRDGLIEGLAMMDGPASAPVAGHPKPPTKRHTGQTDDPAPGEPRVGPASHVVFAKTTHSNANDTNNASIGIATGTSHTTRNRPEGRTGATMESTVPEKPRNFDMHHFLAHRTAGRNAQFHGLTREEREHLGGCEYRALKILAVVVPLYFFLWQFFGCIAVGAWINNYQPATATGNGINPWWAGIFNGVSAFNNSGMSLLDANMIPFENAHLVLITMGLMILAGNTAYPIFLRLIFWTGLKVLKQTTGENALCDLKTTLEFILRYPRRVYTNLFPSLPTWWLLFMLITLNCTDWVAFELLNLGNPVVNAIPTGSRVLDGLFQALAVRSGGFYVVPITSLYIGLQVLYVIMMYISVYPVVITMRHSNVYEERSLGIYANDASQHTPESPDLELGPTSTAVHHQQDHSIPGRPHSSSGSTTVSVRARRPHGRATQAAELGRAIQHAFTPWHGVGVPPPASPDSPGGSAAESRTSFISQQIHGQMAHDIWWLVVAVLAISTIETSHFLADPVDYSVFNVVFEVVSAYGCVGISVGLPTAAYSFSGGWHGASKLVLCAVMLRGRHRGLPVALDRAVRLPGEQLHREEEEDHRIRMSMTGRRVSIEP